MLKLIFCFSVVGLVAPSSSPSLLSLNLAEPRCPSGFDLVKGGECRGCYEDVISTFNDHRATQSIISKCNQINGKPIIIHDSEHQSYWSSRIPTGEVRIDGLICNTSSKKWQWSDGTSMNYKPPSYNSVLDQNCTNDPYWMLRYDGYWYSGASGVESTAHVCCTTQLQTPVRSGDGCDIFEDDKDDGVCYQVGETAQNWQEAQLNCLKFGANLASIHSDQANSFLRRLAVSKGAVDGLYIGASISGNGKDYGWIDGTPWNYVNFYPGFPKDGLGACVAMDTSNTAGQWMNMDCSSKFPVACSREQRPVAQPVCSTGPFVEGQMIVSPGFPFTANTTCDWFLSVDSGKKVEVVIVFLEANTCCDSLILYDNFLGGNKLATFTGEKRNVTVTAPSNVMKVSWQPNGGVNVMGMAMTYYGV